MAQLIDEVRQTGNTVLGSLNLDFSYALGVLVKQIIVTPASAATIFDVSIIDKNSDIVYSRPDEEECLNELLELPIKGSYTLQIRNATANEAFVVKIIAHEMQS